MNSPVDSRECGPCEARSRAAVASTGAESLSAIVAVVAVAAVIIAGLLYILQPPAGTPGTVTGEAPTVTTPAPAPKPNTGVSDPALDDDPAPDAPSRRRAVASSGPGKVELHQLNRRRDILLRHRQPAAG